MRVDVVCERAAAVGEGAWRRREIATKHLPSPLGAGTAGATVGAIRFNKGPPDPPTSNLELQALQMSRQSLRPTVWAGFPLSGNAGTDCLHDVAVQSVCSSCKRSC